MATSGPRDLVGVCGIGPAPCGALRDTDVHWEAPEIAVIDAPPLDGDEADDAQRAAERNGPAGGA